MKNVCWAVAGLSIGVFFAFQSAGPMAILGALFIFVQLLLLFGTFLWWIGAVFSKSGTRVFGYLLLQIVLMVIGVLAGILRGNQLMRLTLRQGDEIAASMEAYKKEHGMYPLELKSFQDPIPVPKVYGSSFAIKQQGDRVTLGFSGIGMVGCWKELPDGSWTCDD